MRQLYMYRENDVHCTHIWEVGHILLVGMLLNWMDNQNNHHNQLFY